jgi:hypothetical protein
MTRCRAGHYTGMINGTLQVVGLLSVSNVAGTLRMELERSGEPASERLTIKGARIEGVDQDRNTFSADLTGR